MARPHVDFPRLQRTFSSPALSWVLERLRQRLERGQPLQGVLTLRNATADQREAVDRLLGRPPTRGSSLSVDLGQLEATLRHAEMCRTLAEAAEALLGPVANKRLARAECAAQWLQLFDDQRCRMNGNPRRMNWLADLQATGLLRRLSRDDLDRARSLLQQAMRVLEALPCQGVPLAEFAANILGDSHALDAGRATATLVLRAFGEEDGSEGAHAVENRRDAWAAVGVMLDELSTPVLTLNVRADGDSLTGRSLNLHAAAGEPCRVSIRQLLRHPPRFDPQTLRAVYMCENPTVVAAAANRLGARSAPLVCIEGQPKTAARLLLDGLTAAGIRLLYHGDFDWSGIRIANLIISRHGAAPWRFDTHSYRTRKGTKLLFGEPVPASWDADLMPGMVAVGRALHEEQVLDDLLGDLAARARRE